MKLFGFYTIQILNMITILGGKMRKITKNIYSVGVQNPLLRVFDIVFNTEFGTSYNAYLIKGQNKNALIEAVHEDFFDDYLINIQKIVPIEDIDYLILNHTEPDHSGAVKKLLSLNPNITVLATSAGHKYLSSIMNIQYQALIAKDGETIDLGNFNLSFISAPMLHWPDSMFTWCMEEKILFTCDFFGAHYGEGEYFDFETKYPSLYEKAFRDYYDGIFSPFKPFVLEGLEKIKALDIKLICPSHGLMLEKTIKHAMAKYQKWSTKTKKDKLEALIIYVSAYGYTKKIASEIEATLVNQYGITTISYDLVNDEFSNLNQVIDNADLLFIGTPTINRDALKPIWDITSLIDVFNNRGKVCGVFGSYGWSGEGVPMIVERLKSLKLNVIDEGIKVLFAPNDDDLIKIRSYVDKVVSTFFKR